MKYGARKTECAQKHTHDSKGEAGRCDDLHVQQRLGTIHSLSMQPEFPVVVNGKAICIYRADFDYMVAGCRIIEDFKGVRTPVYNLKKKLVEATSNIVVTEFPPRVRKKRKAKK